MLNSIIIFRIIVKEKLIAERQFSLDNKSSNFEVQFKALNGYE